MFYLTIFLFGLFSCSESSSTQKKENSANKKVTYSYKVLKQSDSCYHYKIFKDNLVFIYQQIIPAISGKKKFNSENEAKKIAELVVFKLNNSIVPPTITFHELDSLGIMYK